jgi:hypothetical protein
MFWMKISKKLAIQALIKWFWFNIFVHDVEARLAKKLMHNITPSLE